MIVTVDIPDLVNRKLEALKRKSGMSKSLIVRQILEGHFIRLKSEQKEVRA